MENWDKVFEEVPASFEDRIVSTLASLEEKPKIRRFRMPAGGLIAAVLTVVVLGGTALATNLFGLKSITVADPYATPEAVGDVIALQGAPESPEFRANAQWMDYLASVGVSAGDEAPADGSYALYSVYSPEMAEQLESIASTYGLNEYIAGIISGIILFLILGSEFFLQYRLIFRHRAEHVEKGGADK